jgi:hypothetical protein
MWKYENIPEKHLLKRFERSYVFNLKINYGPSGTIQCKK